MKRNSIEDCHASEAQQCPLNITEPTAGCQRSELLLWAWRRNLLSGTGMGDLFSALTHGVGPGHMLQPSEGLMWLWWPRSHLRARLNHKGWHLGATGAVSPCHASIPVVIRGAGRCISSSPGEGRTSLKTQQQLAGGQLYLPQTEKRPSQPP